MKKLLVIFTVIFFLLGLFFAFLYVAWLDGYRLNKTNSIPLGVYKIEQSKEYKRGDLVTFCLTDEIVKSGRAKGYIHGGICTNGSTPLAKEILAVPNDYVEVDSEGVTVNGKFHHLPKLSFDGYGNKVEQDDYKGSINGYFLIGNNNIASWDSRYYGDIPYANIEGKLNEIYIF